jgi:two-component system response regulator
MPEPILYVEDSPDDVEFMKRAFRKVAPDLELKVITNGQEAADYFAQPEPEEKPLALVLLDLNLPGRSGMEVLAQIRSKYKFAKVPVIIFSASSQQSDIDSCYTGGCNSYVVKPSNPDGLKRLVTSIHEYWILHNRTSKLPGGIAIVSTP